MRTNQLAPTNGVFQVPCPPGMEVRIVGVRCTIAGPVFGDQFELHYIRDTIQLIVASGANTNNTAEVDAAIGIDAVTPLQTVVTPVTGVVVYTEIVSMPMALPDIWWPYELIVSPIAPNAVVTPIVLLYQLRRLE